VDGPASAEATSSADERSRDEGDVTLESVCREVDTTLALVEANEINLAYVLYQLIEKAPPEDRPAVLKHTAENWRSAASSHEYKFSPVISDNEQKELEERYGLLVDRFLVLLLDEKPSVETFYERLYAVICNPIFETAAARVFALLWFLLDKRIPYFELQQGLRISNEDWQALSIKLRVELARIKFILASSFDQRSEQADLLLRELDHLEGPDRVRLMAVVVWELERAKSLLAELESVVRH
jgi:hypothetical protein